MNQITLIGNTGKEPEAKTFENGNKIVNFSLAVTKRWNSDGQKKEKTDWFHLVFNGKLADVAEKYVKKGDKVAVVGEMRSREYEKDGVKRQAWEVYVNQMEMLGGGEKKDDQEVAEIFPPRKKSAVESIIPEAADDFPF